jgi:hypothetical protein
MEIIEKKKYILFLPGIFIEDCLEEVIDNPDLRPEILEEFDSDEEPEKKLAIELNYFLEYEDKKSMLEEKKVEKYEPIPKYFIDEKYADVQKTWPTTCNLLCSYCHNSIRVPYPIALNKLKLLIPEDDEINIPEKLKYDNYCFEKDEFVEGNMREVKAYKLHNIAFCDINHVVSYIKRINDPKIINKKESLQMTLQIYKQITGQEVLDLAEKELWVVMKPYCGDTGQSKSEYLLRTTYKK